MKLDKRKQEMTLPNSKLRTDFWPYVVVSGLGVTQIIGWGTIFYPPAVLADQMGHELGVGREAVFLGITVVMLAGAATSTKIGALIDQRGSRALVSLGAVVTALALSFLAYASNQLVFWLSWGLLGLVSPLVLSTGVYAAMVQIAGKHARKAVSALTLFSGFSSTIFYPATHFLVEQTGWRNTYLVFAALHVFVCLPLFLVLLSPRRNKIQVTKETIPPALSGRKATWAFGLFSGLVMANTLVSAGLTLHLINVFGALGLAAGAAITAASLTGPSQVSGRAIEMLLGNRYPAITTAVVAVTLQVMSFIIILSGPPQIAVWIFVVVYGLSNGLMTIVRASVPLVLFGTRKYGTMIGRVNVAFSLTNAVAPVLFATLFSQLGPLSLLWICEGLALLAALIVGILYLVWKGREQVSEPMPGE
ncbi:MFS transporter [Roseibium sp. ROS1]